MRAANMRSAVRAGLIASAVICYVALVGMVEKLSGLWVVGSKLSLGWLMVVLPPAAASYLVLRPKVVSGEEVTADNRTALAVGGEVGLASGVVVAAAIGLVNLVGVDAVRPVFQAASPKLVGILTFHENAWVGAGILVALLTTVGIAASALRMIHARARKAIVRGLTAIVVMGLLQRIVPTALDQLRIPRGWLYSRSTLGLSAAGAVTVFVIAATATVLLEGRSLRDLLRPSTVGTRVERDPINGRFERRQVVGIALCVVIAAGLLALPYIVGPVVSRTLGTVGIFLLLGLGLNIVVGYAGLLDLGYVAFFALGAYFTAILTGGQRVTVIGLQPPAIGARLSFFVAIPIVVVMAAIIGALIGAPVLRLRGDYLAIVTLGFGEIARVIFGSVWAQGLFGGSLGMSGIPGAPIGSYQFQSDPRHFYYLALAFCALAVYVSWRLQDSRIGRAWNAMREDEQVADAMGISTVRYKLLAFAIGGAIGSIGGALFAVSLGVLTITSFQILVSIKALSLIILGGLGSIPGVIVGALVLIGLPGVLSEFEEYQLLIYGAALVAMMVLRPQGLVPNIRRMRELREEDRSQDKWAGDLVADEEAPRLTPLGEGSG